MSLPTRTKLSFGFGSLAFGIKDQGFGALLMLYYNQVVGLSAAYVGTAILIATMLDAVLDPLIGQASVTLAQEELCEKFVGVDAELGCADGVAPVGKLLQAGYCTSAVAGGGEDRLGHSAHFISTGVAQLESFVGS